MFSLSNPHSLACGIFPFYWQQHELQEKVVSRDAAKKLKQAFAAAQDEVQRKAAAVALLKHSLDLGHRRLSLMRLEAAISCGAALADEDLHRCADLALMVSDPGIHARLAQVSRRLAAVLSSSAS
ncbi:hypothetical protein LLG90_22095 [Aromatoleum toluclasticum]|uniref:hypothetical protein n=1 Tax=Aromatoleum toluclasticum TaxID=92003 RepID=UPI001D195E73|nr:hypothetical protein [Aromatoleum toluclasticum]MCC4118049.1 hypothetical protein [Aromatoleum toluclasticum]